MNTNNFKFADLTWLQEKEGKLKDEISKLNVGSANFGQLAFELFSLLGYMHSYISNHSMLGLYGTMGCICLLIKWGTVRIKEHKLKIKKEAKLELIKEIKRELIHQLLEKNLPDNFKSLLLSEYKDDHSYY